MPGQEKMVSVTMVPARSVPNCRPRMVRMGISALRKAWRKRTAGFGEAFGAGGADVVGGKLFDHGGANHASEDGGERGAQREGGKDEMSEAAASGNGEPAEDHGKKENQDRAEREIGDGEAEESEEADGVIGTRAAFVGGEEAGGNADGGADQERDDGEFERGGIVFEDNLRDRLLEAKGFAEIAVDDAAEIAAVLHGDAAGRGRARGGAACRSSARAPSPSICCDGIAGNDVREEEDHGEDEPERGKSEEQAE